jgi:hypothetical protein
LLEALDALGHLLAPGDAGELSRPPFDVCPVQSLPLPARHADRVFQVAGTAGEELVDDQIFGRRERNLDPSESYSDRSLDRLSLVRRGR